MLVWKLLSGNTLNLTNGRSENASISNKLSDSCFQLKERNKEDCNYQIKWVNSVEEAIAPFCTDNLTYTNQQPNQIFNIVVINFQSILAKKAGLSLFISEQQPDIIFGTETWLLPKIKSAEFLPSNYKVIRHDREDRYGGVLLGFCNDLNIVEY